MLTSVIVRVIDFCTRHAWQVVVVGLVMAGASGVYAARHFAINSDISDLLSNDIGWRKRELAFEQAFNRFERIFVVVEAPTPELASEATAALTQELAKNKQRFQSVAQLGGGEFFAKNGLLFQSVEDLKRNTALTGPGRAARPRSGDRSEPARSHRRPRRRPARHPVG